MPLHASSTVNKTSKFTWTFWKSLLRKSRPALGSIEVFSPRVKRPGHEFDPHLQRETRLWMIGAVSLFPPTPYAFKAWKGTPSTYNFFLERVLACPKTPECQSFTKLCTVNISVICRHLHHKWFRTEFQLIEQDMLSSLSTSFYGMIFLWISTSRGEGVNAGHSPSKFNTGSYNQNILSHRECQK